MGYGTATIYSNYWPALTDKINNYISGMQIKTRAGNYSFLRCARAPDPIIFGRLSSFNRLNQSSVVFLFFVYERNQTPTSDK